MFVKICGTTSLLDAQLAVDAGADALGFIFAPSKRRVTPAAVAAMVSHLPSHIDRVGVFTSGTSEEISAAVREAQLSAVQLHMATDAALLQDLSAEFGEGLKLWQVVTYETSAPNPATADESFVAAMAASLGEPRIAVTLLDAAKNGASGGLGMSFPWERVAVLVQHAQELARARSEKPGNFAIAGGLNPGNVTQAIQILNPWGVDCVSGVEAEPGRKDPTRLRAFLRLARGEHSENTHSGPTTPTSP